MLTSEQLLLLFLYLLEYYFLDEMLASGGGSIQYKTHYLVLHKFIKMAICLILKNKMQEKEACHTLLRTAR